MNGRIPTQHVHIQKKWEPGSFAPANMMAEKVRGGSEFVGGRERSTQGMGQVQTPLEERRDGSTEEVRQKHKATTSLSIYLSLSLLSLSQ